MVSGGCGKLIPCVILVHINPFLKKVERIGEERNINSLGMAMWPNILAKAANWLKEDAVMLWNICRLLSDLSCCSENFARGQDLFCTPQEGNFLHYCIMYGPLPSLIIGTQWTDK